MKILGAMRYGIAMPDTIQPGEYSMGSGTGGAPHICYATFNRWNDKRNVNVDRNDNDWNDNWWFAGRRNYLLMNARFTAGVRFSSLPARASP